MKSKIIKFGKRFGDIFAIKKSFFNDNDSLVKKQKKIARIYKSQSKRKKCKVCEAKLYGPKFFNHKIEYIICSKCSHVNGRFNDTEYYSKKIYESENINYSKTYRSDNLKEFQNRQSKIYDPKVKFLRNFLKKDKSIEILDFGCGSGYLISSLIDHGFKNVKGVEVSNNQINYGKNVLKKFGKNPLILSYVTRKKIFDEISNTNAKCITLIGVLEHIVNVKYFMSLIKKNKNLKYIYLSVPMFSLSSVIENNYSNVFNRHLGGGHTHLFTEKSLIKLMNRNGFYEKGSWWFGTDIPDLFRSFNIQINKNKSLGLKKVVNDFGTIIDDLQLQLDKKKLSSQVHMFLERKNSTSKKFK